MKKLLVTSGILTIALLVTMVFVLNYNQIQVTEPVYVGITYCGNSVEDAKLLIDKTKDYTNLFILGSGTLQRDLQSVNEMLLGRAHPHGLKDEHNGINQSFE